MRTVQRSSGFRKCASQAVLNKHQNSSHYVMTTVNKQRAKFPVHLSIRSFSYLNVSSYFKAKSATVSEILAFNWRKEFSSTSPFKDRDQEPEPNISPHSVSGSLPCLGRVCNCGDHRDWSLLYLGSSFRSTAPFWCARRAVLELSLQRNNIIHNLGEGE